MAEARQQQQRERIAAAPPVGGDGHVVVVGNLKGGSGKSTLVINLAGALAAAGKSVAVLDCDPQGTISGWAARAGGAAVVPVRFEPLRNLNGAGGWLVTAGEMRRQVDVLLIDLPGVVAPAMGAAFLIASLILVPTSPHAVDVEGTRRVLGHLERARAERPGAPPEALLVPVRVREMERGMVSWRRTLEGLGLPMTPPMRQQSAYDQAYEEGRWVGDRFPGSDAHREMQAVAARVLEALDRAPAPLAFGGTSPRPAAAPPVGSWQPRGGLHEAPAALFVQSGDGAATGAAPAGAGAAKRSPPGPQRSLWRRVLGLHEGPPPAIRAPQARPAQPPRRRGPDAKPGRG